MASRAETILARRLDALLVQHGEQITYTPQGGSAVTPTAIIGPEETEQQTDDGGNYLIRRRRITITTDPDGTHGGVADAQVNATITAAGETWSVERIAHQQAGYVELVAYRREERERTRRDYRYGG